MADERFDQGELFEAACARAVRYWQGLAERSVAPEPKALRALEAWADAASLPATGRPEHEVLRELDEIASPATVASAGPRYFGFVTGGSLPAALAASWLAAAWDQNAFSQASSPAAVRVEQVAARWVLELLGLPAGAGVAFTTGATLANFAALAAARRTVLAKLGWDVDADGLFGAPPIGVLVSAESHPTVRKALGLLGLGRRRVSELPVDQQGRIRAERLPGALPGEPAAWIVCAQAGNVNSGAADPFGALRDWCDARGAWLHVDGAFGLWAQASPRLRTLTAGVERADSWATDAHKWLNVPYDCGIAVVREPAALSSAMSIEAPYLPAGAPREPFHFGPESSRRARGVEVWAALRNLGRDGLAALLERCVRHAQRFAAELAAAGYAVANDVVLNQVVVRFGDDAATRAVVERVQRAGVCWCGPTVWQGRAGMRISVSGWATREADVERSLASILACASDVLAGRGAA